MAALVVACAWVAPAFAQVPAKAPPPVEPSPPGKAAAALDVKLADPPLVSGQATLSGDLGGGGEVEVLLSGQADNELPPAEELLKTALANNPDVALARARLAEAEAELNRARMLTTRQVLSLRKAVETQRQIVERAEKLYQQGTSSQGDLSRAAVKLSKLEAELEYAAGGKVRRERWVHLKHVTGDWQPADMAPPKGQMADQIRRKLGQTLENELLLENVTLTGAARYLAESFNVNVVIDKEGLARSEMPSDWPINVQVRDVTLGAALQAIEDLNGPLRFVVRDYGLLITTEEGTPQGAILLGDFLRSEAHEPTADPKSAPPADNVPTAIKPRK